MQRSATFSLLLLSTLAGLLLPALPAHAQEDDENVLIIGGLPAIRFDVGVMQAAQFLRADDDALLADEAAFGFQRVRFNLTLGMDITDRINAVVDLGHEPNDFGDDFAPAVDYAVVNLLLTEQLAFQFGTPVTTLFHFRGYSDGAAVQGNPMIGNSPADFVTAETGVQLNGAYDGFAFDLTVTSPTFFETYVPGTGPSVILKGHLRPNEQVGLGAAVGRVFSGGAVDRYFDGELTSAQIAEAAGNWLGGDGENYTLAGLGQPNRYTHARLLPGFESTLLQVDALLTAAQLSLEAWGGYGFAPNSFAGSQGGTPVPQGSDLTEEDSEMWWLGSTVKLNVTEQVYVAGRGTVVNNASDWVDDDTALYRIQAGFGVRFQEYALFKTEYVYQAEQENSPGQVGTDWQGVSAELSVVF